MKEYKKNFMKIKAYSHYHSSVKVRINPYIGDIELKALRGDMVQKMINNLYSQKLSSQTIRSTHTILKSALRQAVNNGLIAKNPAENATLPKAEKPQIKVLTQEEQNRFIETAKEMLHGEIFIVGLATGLRIGELITLTWDDIDFERGTLQVNKHISTP